jgi:hypothetical protein
MGIKMSKKIILNLVAIALLILAVVPQISIPNIVPLPIPTPAVNLDLDTPTDEILSIVNPISRLVTNKDDRIKLAVFNYSFSKRINKYNTDTQKINDIYVLAARYFFEDSMKDKYDTLPEELKTLFKTVVGEDNHTITAEEKVALQNVFGGLAWRLIK